MPEIIGLKKDETKNLYVFLISLDGTNTVEVPLTKQYLDQLLASETPSEEKSLNDALKEIQRIRMERVLYIEKIDDELKKLVIEAENKLGNAQNKLETFRYASLMKTKLAIITQKRHLSKLAANLEAELRVKLAKLQRGE